MGGVFRYRLSEKMDLAGREKVGAGLSSCLLYLSAAPALPLPITAPMSSDSPMLPPPDLSQKDPANGEKKRKRGATRLSCAECRR